MNNSAIQLQPGEDGERGVPAQRNRLINGQFSIWQRTTSFPAPVVPILGLVGYSADRWQWQAATDGAVMLGSGMTRQTFDPGQSEVPDNPIYFMRWEMTGMSIPTVFAASNLVQRIESVRTLSGKTATLSFWMRGDINGTIAMSLLQWPGSGGTVPSGPPASLLPTNFTVTANTWTFHRLTLDIPSIIGFVLGPNNDDGLYLRFHNLIDANIATQQGFPTQISYAGQLDFANVQLEESDIAVPEFEHRPIEIELSLCQRYFCKAHDIDTAPFNMSAVPGVQDASQNNTPGIFETHADINSGGNTTTMLFPVRMRAAPSLAVVQVQPSVGPTAVQSLTANFIGEGSVSWRSQNTLVAFLWTADAEF